MSALSLAIVAVACVVIGLFIAAGRLAATTGVAVTARVVSSDVGPEPSQTLVEPVLRLRGRPDYLVREAAGMVPIEIKPTRRATSLYESDRTQLGTYLLLVRATYPDVFAGYGRVRYAEAAFEVPLTTDLAARVIAIANAIRRAREVPPPGVHRSHDIPAKCRACAVRTVCGEALEDAKP